MKRVLHTVSYAGVWRGQARLSLEDAIRKAADLGYDGVEIVGKRPHASILDYGPAEREALRRLLDDSGVECACMAGYTDFTAGSDRPDIPLHEIQIAYVEQLARMARDLGGKIVRVFTGYHRAGIPFATQWEWCVNGLRDCADRAASLGVTIAVQNHHDIAVTAEDLTALMEEIDRPNCGAAYDAWAPTLQGLDIRADTERIARHIVYTTVADYQVRKQFAYDPSSTHYEPRASRTVAVRPGEGIIDYRTFFSVLRKHGYNGSIAYEMCSELVGGGSMTNLDSFARDFLSFMESTWAAAGPA